MARTVDDLALLLSVMAGPDRRSPMSLEGAGSDFADSGPGSLAGLRIAFSPDLGGAVQVEPEIARERSGPRRRACETHGAVGRGGQPRLHRRRRVLPDPAGLAVRGHPGRASSTPTPTTVRPSLYANMLAGRELTGPQIGRAVVLRTTLFHRMREFLDDFDALILPVAPLPAFDADLQYPTWWPASRNRTTWAGCAPSAMSRSPVIRRSPCRPVSPRPGRRSACRSSAGTGQSGQLLAIAKGFENGDRRYAMRRPGLLS